MLYPFIFMELIIIFYSLTNDYLARPAYFFPAQPSLLKVASNKHVHFY